MAELIDRPVRFGTMFDKPDTKFLRHARNARGVKLIGASDARLLIDKIGVNLRACVLLAMNCGYGPADCAGHNRSHLSERGGWTCYPRSNSGIERQCSL